MKKKKKFPSQIKYEKEHPLISFRVKRDEYEKIQQLADKSRKSKSVLVRMVLLGLEKDFSATYKSIQETKKQELKDIWYKKGHDVGYTESKNDWTIRVKCRGCKKEAYIQPNSYEHKKIQKIMDGYQIHEICPLS